MAEGDWSSERRLFAQNAMSGRDDADGFPSASPRQKLSPLGAIRLQFRVSLVDAPATMTGSDAGPIGELVGSIAAILMTQARVPLEALRKPVHLRLKRQSTRVKMTSNGVENKVFAEEIRSSIRPEEDEGRFLLTSCRLAVLGRNEEDVVLCVQTVFIPNFLTCSPLLLERMHKGEDKT
ncbi:unnamed protein product [Protopolystoma xenopodis]|uniref:Uncharacterized protein n=1 Tax=Protopolystoma xenopodis TaxID=117903 RepID=A0A3S5BI10_9PLAT|nr:unnamed protein product [Protopolystoma xenopodis]